MDLGDIFRQDQRNGEFTESVGVFGQLIGNYYRGMIAAGMPNEVAVPLTMSFQQTFVQQIIAMMEADKAKAAEGNE